MRVHDVRASFDTVYKMEHELYVCSSTTNRLCVSADGKYCLVGSNNGSIVIFDLTTGQLEEIYQGVHTTAVVGIDWQPRGSKFASVDNLGGLFIWDK